MPAVLENEAKDAKAAWVESVFGTMNLRQKIGQLLAPFLVDDESPSGLTCAEMVEKYHLGGGHVPRGSIAHYRETIEKSQAAADIPLFVTADMEAGPGCTIDNCTAFPYHMGFAAAGDEALAYEMGKVTALESRAIGVNWNFGPVIDIVATHRYYRSANSFSSDPVLAGRLAGAMIKGMQDHGMIATAKHFPGDGHNENDQHLTTPVLDIDYDEWMEVCVEPFKMVIDAGVHSIMNGHIAVPCAAPDDKGPRGYLPSSLSRTLTTGVLREQLGYEGVIISDALTMGGCRIHYPKPRLYGEALKAGNDVLLYIRDVGETADHLVKLVESGEVPEEQIDASVKRVLTMKAAVGLHEEPVMAPQDECDRIVASTAFRDTAAKAARKAVTLVRDSQNVLPLNLGKGRRVGHILLTSVDKGLDTFEASLRQGGCAVESLKDIPAEELYMRVRGGEFDALAVSLYFPYQWGFNTSRAFGQAIRPLVAGWEFADAGTPAVFISWLNPFHLYEFGYMDPFLCTFGTCEASQKAAADALLGKAPVTGKMPVDLVGYFKKGDGVQLDGR